MQALIDGAGFASHERFGEAVSHHAWRKHGVKVSYDHIRVRRWLDGGKCQYPSVVADVLSIAWGIPIPVGVIWPDLRNGDGPVPAHLQAWLPARTLEDLGFFVRSDMLTRREVLTDAVGLAAGASLIEPVVRWMTAKPVPVEAATKGAGHIGLAMVSELEQASCQLRASDAQLGAGLIREAAVGQLKYAVDLIQHASYDHATGQRLLASIVDLASTVGWMSHDVNMLGPAQRYFVYALQAARESGHERARLRSVGILCNMARQLQSVDRPDTAVRLLDLALDQLPADRRRHNDFRANTWGLKARMLAELGADHAPEARSAADLSFELRAKARDEDVDPVLRTFFPWVFSSDAELYADVADGYRALARHEPRHAATAEAYALRALRVRGPRFARSMVFDHVSLAQTRILRGELEQACADGKAALALASQVSSCRVTSRLRDLHDDLTPYARQPDVRDVRDELRQSLAA